MGHSVGGRSAMEQRGVHRGSPEGRTWLGPVPLCQGGAVSLVQKHGG